jgi:mRNA interferase RelE/StbE
VSEYRAVVRPEVQAELRKVPRDMALRILARLTELESDPSGYYRVVYTIDNSDLVVWVVPVGHRSTVHDT